MDDGMCTKCKQPIGLAAGAFRLRDTLSSDEKTYYNTQVPILLKEVQGIHREIKEMRSDIHKMVLQMEKDREYLKELFSGKKNKKATEPTIEELDDIKQSKFDL